MSSLLVALIAIFALVAMMLTLMAGVLALLRYDDRKRQRCS